MKAWSVKPYEDYEYDQIIFAETRNQAKLQCEDYDSWIEIRAKRIPFLDGRENDNTDSITLDLIKYCGWWYEYKGKKYDSNNVQELEEILGVVKK